MALRFRPDRKKFEVAITLRGKRIRKLFDTKKDAKEFIRDIDLRKLNLEGLDLPYTLEEAFSSFIETESTQKTERTLRADRRFLALALYFLTKERNLTTVDEVGFEDLQYFQLWAARPQNKPGIAKEAWSDTTVSHCSKLIKQVFRKLERTGRIKKNPAEYWKVPCGTGLRRRPMSQEEFEKLYRFSPEWFKPILAFIRLTGARGASVASIVWGDIDFEAKTLVLRSRKGGLKKTKTIMLPLYEELYEFLSNHRINSLEQKNGDISKWDLSVAHKLLPIFKNKFGQPITAENISSYGHHLIKTCGLEGLVIYSLRHAIAVDMTKADISLETTRQAMGHSNIAQTSDYARGIDIDSVNKAFNQIRSRSGKKIVPPDDTKE